MKVSELAEDLELPASAVLAQCQRFGITATWAGAELNATDVVILRAELASDDALDLTEPEPDVAPVPAAAPAVAATPGPEAAPAPPQPPAAAALPPTAVGSMPGLIDEVTPEPEAPPADGFRGGSLPGAPGVTEEARRVAPLPPVDKKPLDRSARNAVLALLLAVAAFAVSNLVDAAAAVVALWAVSGALLVMALVDSIKGRRHVQTHPERLHGLWTATITLVLVVAAMVGLAASILTVIGDDPAADAPAGIGDLASVQTARWGVQRVQLIEGNGWKQPARTEGSCWRLDDEARVRKGERVELPARAESVSCSVQHQLEVGPVFAVDRDADSPYPAVKQIQADATKHCGDLAAGLALQNKSSVSLQVEYPTEAGWDDADHDVACIFVTAERKGSLVD